MRQEDLPERDDYTVSWTVVAALLSAAAFGWGLASRPERAPAPAAAERGVSWFMLLRMPPVTAQYESGIETMKGRYAQWLERLRAAGFVPMLLSDARAKLSRGEGLPARTIVAVFEPGHRRTYEIVAPILAAQRWPAVWLSDAAAMKRGHRELITYRTARLMRASRWWDVGYSRSKGGYAIRSRDRPPFTLGPWSAVDGAFAVNHAARMEGLNILNVNSDWTPEELLNRLLAEVPACEPTRLTKGVIHGREWGLADSSAARGPAAFDLRAPLIRRGSKLFWLGTRTSPDFRLELEAASYVGEFRVHLRSDEAAGRQTNLIFSERKLIVEELSGAKRRVLLVGRHAASPGRRLKADIRLTGRRLAVSYQGRTWATEKLSQPAGGAGLLEISVFDKTRGAARADKIQLLFTPIAL